MAGFVSLRSSSGGTGFERLREEAQRQAQQLQAVLGTTGPVGGATTLTGPAPPASSGMSTGKIVLVAGIGAALIWMVSRKKKR